MNGGTSRDNKREKKYNNGIVNTYQRKMQKVVKNVVSSNLQLCENIPNEIKIEIAKDDYNNREHSSYDYWRAIEVWSKVKLPNGVTTRGQRT